MTDATPEGTLLKGVCKHWNTQKGFGFVTSDEYADDLFVHQSELQTDKFRALRVGDKCQGLLKLREGKPILTQVTGPDGAPLVQFESKLDASSINAENREGAIKGTIKWFKPERGFGFIVPEAGGDDMFVHVKQIEHMQPPLAGDEVEYLVTTDPTKGKPVATQVVNKSARKRTPAEPQTTYFPPPTGGPPGYFFAYPQQQQQPQLQQGAYGGYGGGAPAGFATSYGAGYGAPAAQPLLAGGTKKGIIKFFGVQKGFGFIIPEGGGMDVYFQGTACAAPELLRPEMLVEYKEKVGQEGKVWAHWVRAVQPGGGRKRKPEEAGLSTYGQRPAPGIQDYQNGAAAGAFQQQQQQQQQQYQYAQWQQQQQQQQQYQ